MVARHGSYERNRVESEIFICRDLYKCLHEGIQASSGSSGAGCKGVGRKAFSRRDVSYHRLSRWDLDRSRPARVARTVNLLSVFRLVIRARVERFDCLVHEGVKERKISLI
jgi:hypothetical protein